MILLYGTVHPAHPHMITHTHRYDITPHHITSHHITSHHTTSYHIISHHITHHITSHHITPHHTTPHHITPHHTTSHHTTSHHTTSHHTTSHHITPHLITDVKQTFDALDEEGTGTIQVQNVRHLLVALGDKNPSKEDVINYMKELDTNNSGDIDFDEFKKWYVGGDIPAFSFLQIVFKMDIHTIQYNNITHHIILQHIVYI